MTTASRPLDETEPAEQHRRRRSARPHSGDGPQHLLITLLGDYWFAREEMLPSAALVELLGEFGTHENAARQAMRRLTQRGGLVQDKRGRKTFYGIPPEIVAGQRLRLARAVTFGADFLDWDRQWTVVTYSIPEAERDVRRQLRNGLRTTAFGDLQDGVWISPHDRRADAVELLDDLGVASGQVMRATWELRAGDREAIADAFDLGGLSARYRDFIADYGARIPWASGTVSPVEALRVRTRLTNDWLSFRLVDPELPATLLPSDWPRREARETFLELYALLGSAAAAHVRQTIARHDESLSRIVTHHQAPKATGRVTPEMARAVQEDRHRGLI